MQGAQCFTRDKEWLLTIWAESPYFYTLFLCSQVVPCYVHINLRGEMWCLVQNVSFQQQAFIPSCRGAVIPPAALLASHLDGLCNGHCSVPSVLSA